MHGSCRLAGSTKIGSAQVAFTDVVYHVPPHKSNQCNAAEESEQGRILVFKQKQKTRYGVNKQKKETSS